MSQFFIFHKDLKAFIPEFAHSQQMILLWAFLNGIFASFLF